MNGGIIMMNILYENRYFGTKRMAKEYVSKVICRRLLRACAVIMFFSIVLMSFAKLSNAFGIVGILAGCLITTLTVAFIAPIYTTRKLIKYHMQLNNGEKEECLVQFGDEIYMKDIDGERIIYYSQIVSIYDLRNSYILMLNNKKGIMISKESFTAGDLNTFKGFIKKMCPHAKYMA